MDWAGGLIDWNSQDVKTNGYFYSMFNDVNIQCYNAPSDANVTGKTSYVYTNSQGVEKSIAVTDNPTVLKSLLGTGKDMNKDLPNASASKSGGAPAATSGVATVPGLTGAGPGTDGTRGGGSSGNSGDTGSGGSGTSSAGGSTSTGIGGFTQGDTSSSKKGSSAVKNENAMVGSMFAALMAFSGMLLMM